MRPPTTCVCAAQTPAQRTEKKQIGKRKPLGNINVFIAECQARYLFIVHKHAVWMKFNKCVIFTARSAISARPFVRYLFLRVVEQLILKNTRSFKRPYVIHTVNRFDMSFAPRPITTALLQRSGRFETYGKIRIPGAIHVRGWKADRALVWLTLVDRPRFRYLQTCAREPYSRRKRVHAPIPGRFFCSKNS